MARSILIVEDEPLVALDVHGALSEAGASVIAATTVDDALDLIAYADISAAIADVNLGQQDCAPVCEALAARQCLHGLLRAAPAASLHGRSGSH